MKNNRLIDQDLMDLFTELIKNEVETEILKIYYSEESEEAVLEKLIAYLETDDAQFWLFN